MDSACYSALAPFNELQFLAEERMDMPPEEGKVIGFFKLKNTITLLVQSAAPPMQASDDHSSAALIIPVSARKLIKKEAIKIRDVGKKVHVKAHLFEQSFLCGIGRKTGRQHICNFVGFQQSSISISARGAISFSGTLACSYSAVNMNGDSNEVASLAVLHEEEQQVLDVDQIQELNPGGPPTAFSEFESGAFLDIQPVITGIEVDECLSSFSGDPFQQGTVNFLEGAVADEDDAAAGCSNALAENSCPRFKLLWVRADQNQACATVAVFNQTCCP